MEKNTIAAISTAQGEGGIGIVRISGSDSLRILQAVFRPVSPIENPFEGRVFRYGYVVDVTDAADVVDVPETVAVAKTVAVPSGYDGNDYYEWAERGGEIAGSVANVADSVVGAAGSIADTADNVETGRAVDEAMAVFMKAPHTYTGEDVAEIHCHGGLAALRKTLALAFF
jgi:tRNA modification GTPase